MTIFIHLHTSEPISTVVNFCEGISYMHKHMCVHAHSHCFCSYCLYVCMFSVPSLFAFVMYAVAVQFVSVCLLSPLSR